MNCYSDGLNVTPGLEASVYRIIDHVISTAVEATGKQIFARDKHALPANC